MKLFECKVRWAVTMPDGTQKKTTETHLLEGISYTEVEERFVKFIKDFISDEFEVKTINPHEYAEVIPYDNENTWYKVDVVLTTINEKTGKEEKTTVHSLVEARDLIHAAEITKEKYKVCPDYSIIMVKQTNYQSVKLYD